MIRGSASVSRDTQVRYLHICTHTHDQRICECFQGYTGSLLTHMYTHAWSEDLRVFPGIHRFVTNTHMYTHMIRGSASVSRDTEVCYWHTHVYTHDQRICECFQGYTGSLLTHTCIHTWSEDLRVFPGIQRFITYTRVHTHMIRGSASVSRDTQVRYLHTHVNTHMIRGSASVSRDTQVRYLHIRTHTHDQRICECFPGYTGSLLTHTCIHTWSEDLRVFPGIHRFITCTHVHTHMIRGSASVSRDTQVRYLHIHTHIHDQRICECFLGYTDLLLTHTYTHAWSQDLRVFPGIHRFVTNTYIHTHMITGSASVSRDTQVRY